MNLIVLKENRNTYQPSNQEIQEYGEYLGLKFPEDDKYRAILVQSLTAPLPSEWQACQTDDEHQNLVYRNKETMQVQYEHPLDQYYRDKIMTLKKLTKNLQIETIAEERQSWLKQSSDMYGKSKDSVEYSLNDKNEGIINQISQEKSVYDNQSLQQESTFRQNQIIIAKKTRTPNRSYKRKKKQPKLSTIKQHLMNYSCTPTVSIKQMEQKKYPFLKSAEQKQKYKKLTQLYSRVEEDRKQLGRLQIQKKAKLQLLEKLKTEIKSS